MQRIHQNRGDRPASRYLFVYQPIVHEPVATGLLAEDFWSRRFLFIKIMAGAAYNKTF